MYINVDEVYMNDHVQPWCSTRDVIGTDWHFGWCGPDCVMHEDTFTWRKDKTIKMTVQYNYNPALWAGLELYGNLLTGFLLYSLILTAFISAISKMNVKISPLNC